MTSESCAPKEVRGTLQRPDLHRRAGARISTAQHIHAACCQQDGHVHGVMSVRVSCWRCHHRRACKAFVTPQGCSRAAAFGALAEHGQQRQTAASDCQHGLPKVWIRVERLERHCDQCHDGGQSLCLLDAQQMRICKRAGCTFCSCWMHKQSRLSATLTTQCVEHIHVFQATASAQHMLRHVVLLGACPAY
jgi:hypothetical protein